MTPEDKQLIAEYMGWYEVMVEDPMNKGVMEKIITKHNHAEAYFDLNDSRLCVEKMVENGDWFEFFKMVDDFLDIDCCGVTAWLFNSQDFFSAMASWLRSKT